MIFPVDEQRATATGGWVGGTPGRAGEDQAYLRFFTKRILEDDAAVSKESIISKVRHILRSCSSTVIITTTGGGARRGEESCMQGKDQPIGFGGELSAHSCAKRK
jgi:hypothetical protein